METGLVIIDAIIITIVILPFVLFIVGRRKRKQKLHNALQSEATLHHRQLGKTEVQSNFAIGLDTTEENVFFYKETEDADYAQVVDLKSISACKFVKESKLIKDKKKHYDIIDKVQLTFEYKNHKAVTTFVLYSNDDDLALNNELTIGQQWEGVVNQVLRSRVAPKSTNNKTQPVVA